MSETYNYEPRIADLEKQMDGVKLELAGVKSDLTAMEKAATAHRSKEEAMLNKIADKVEAIATEQHLERGRREGENSAQGRTGVWARAALPIAVGAGAYMLVSFIQDQAPQPAPPTIVVSPPPTVEVSPVPKEVRK